MSTRAFTHGGNLNKKYDIHCMYIKWRRGQNKKVNLKIVLQENYYCMSGAGCNIITVCFQTLSNRYCSKRLKI